MQIRRLSGYIIAAVIGLQFIAALAARAGELPTFKVILKDGVITPSRLEVPAGKTFKIIIRNSGSGPAEFESLRLRKEKVISPGVESFIVIRRLSPGKYEFFDDFHSGMKTAHATIIAK